MLRPEPEERFAFGDLAFASNPHSTLYLTFWRKIARFTEEMMPVVHEPKPRPSELDYVPQGSTAYKVTINDNWRALAERLEVKAAGMGASDLCFFNFKTRRPSEINWYLYHKVGCRQVTRDGSNYMFSAGDSPGIIYLPKAGHIPRANDVTPKPGAKLNAWFGVVGKGGTQFVVVGIETVAGVVVSLDDPTDWMAVTASINRVGPGWGASGGFAGVYIVGVSGPADLKGHQEGDWDFNLALGPNWGKAAKAVSKTSTLQPLVKALQKLGANTPSTFKRLLKTNPDKYAELIDSLRSFNETMGVGHPTDPKVIVFDLPFGGGGLEASAYFGVSNFNAVWDNL